MGYQGRLFHLQFEDAPGLEVWAKSVSVRKMLSLAKLADAAGSGDATEEQFEELVGVFVSRVKAWTLADEDDKPLPVTVDSLMEWDAAETLRLVLTWFQQVTSVAVPLTVSPGTTPAPEPDPGLESTIPMSPASRDGTS